MKSSQELRRQNLESEKEDLEQEIASLNTLRHKCSQQLRGEGDWDEREQLRIKSQNYLDELKGLYEQLEEIEEQIETLESSLSETSSKNDSDYPRNQQEINFEEALSKLDFDKPLATFNQIPVHFNQDRNIPLFFVEDSFDKKGELYLKRLKFNLTPVYRESFCEHTVQYNSGNLEAVIQGIGHKFGVQKKDLTSEDYINSVITKICNSLQSNSVLFIEIIECNLCDETDVTTFVDIFLPSFTNKFWNPLQKEIKNIAQAYYGIKVIVMMSSEYNLNLSEKLSMKKIEIGLDINYKKTEYYYFQRDDLLNILLENWSFEDVSQWLQKYCHGGFQIDTIEEIVNDIYRKTNGSPVKICYDLQQQWTTLTHPPNSC